MKPSDVPVGSVLHRELSDAYFYDAFEMELPTDGKNALEIYLACVSRTPAWVEKLMMLRNRIVGLFGLKNLGQMARVAPGGDASQYKVGDRVGIFSLLHLADHEVVMTDDDHHLQVKVSVYRHACGKRVTVSTVVHVKNLLGRIYMFVVVPFHKRIVPAVMARGIAA